MPVDPESQPVETRASHTTVQESLVEREHTERQSADKDEGESAGVTEEDDDVP